MEKKLFYLYIVSSILILILISLAGLTKFKVNNTNNDSFYFNESTISDPSYQQSFTFDNKVDVIIDKSSSLCDYSITEINQGVCNNNYERCNEVLLKTAIYQNNLDCCDLINNSSEVLNLCKAIPKLRKLECDSLQNDEKEFCLLLTDLKHRSLLHEEDPYMLNYAYIILAMIESDSNYCNDLIETDDYEYDLEECISLS